MPAVDFPFWYAVVMATVLCVGVPSAARADADEPPCPAPPGAFSDSLIGDPGGARGWLSCHGVTVDLDLTTEMLRNADGGYVQQSAGEGLGKMGLEVDAERAFGVPGGSFNVSAFGIFGRGLTINAVGALATISNIEAERGLRLFELWYDQSFMRGRVSVRIGQLATDEEFLTTAYGGLFMNADFGMPALPSNDLPGGGPNYPLATPAVRLQLKPIEHLTLLAGLFNGNPSPENFGNPQLVNRGGVAFPLNGHALVISEGQFSYDLGGAGATRPGTLKLGGWLNTNTFLDQHYDANGLSLADLNSTGFPALRRHNWSGYAVIDQKLWAPAGAADDVGVGGFVRVMGAPDDRNLISAEVDGGLTFAGLVPGRPHDRFGMAFAWNKISQAARALDHDLVAAGILQPIRSRELLLEATYQAQITPWWLVQPDVQYVSRPGGGVQGDVAAGEPLDNALVFGVRSTITF